MVGVDVKKNNLIGRTNILVSGSCIAYLLSTTANIKYYCMCITLRVGLGLW